MLQMCLETTYHDRESPVITGAEIRKESHQQQGQHT